MEMLKSSSMNISEVSYEVGFSSTSYFIKCFREHYGFPPGEVGKRNPQDPGSANEEAYEKKRNKKRIIGAIAILVVIALMIVVYTTELYKNRTAEKSIAVLPFINDSNDSTNVYIINGLMESILNNLQKIEDLRVVSRTSVEKFRSSPQSIPEISRQLDVRYIVEGSGQKINNQILLTVQLIDAGSDKHVWSAQYDREVQDIFQLQREIARNIASEIQVIITPEEAERIDKAPTENLVAYDHFLKGMEYFYQQNRESLDEAVGWFEKAIAEDPGFALAYANTAISYYFMEIFQQEKQYSEQINNYADQALLYDPKLAQSLIAKALYYMNLAEYEKAVPYLEKALEYNPNSALVINILSDFYTNYLPDTRKYLEYALKGIRLDIASNDSSTTSYIYLHVSNALVQTGFAEEALEYVDRSLSYNPDNLYAEYLRAYVLYALNRDLPETRDLLLKALKKDTTRLDILQEIAKIYYYQRNYQAALGYYRKFIAVKEALNWNVYPGEDIKIAYVLSETGNENEAKHYLEKYKQYAENDRSIYKDLSLGVYYAYTGKTEQALEHIRAFSEQDTYPYWILLFLGNDPLVDSISEHPEFRKIMRDMEARFRRNHKKIRKRLEKEGLI
jgi:TolB-like protein